MAKFQRALKNFSFHKKCTLLTYIVFLQLCVNGQTRSISFDNVTPNEFPEMGYILTIYQDKQDYLWFGTYNGLYRYDGIDYQAFQFREDDSNTISNSVVHVLTEDKNGILWIGTEYGLNRYNRQTGEFKVYHADQNNKNALQHDHIRAINVDNTGILWIGTYGGGLNWFNPETGVFKSIRKSNSQGTILSSDRINCLLRENDSVLWIGTEDGGITRLNTQTMLASIFLAEKNEKHTIADIYLDSYKNLWVGTWQRGLYQYNRQLNVFEKKDILKTGQWTAKSIMEDVDGNLLIGTFGNGLIKYNTVLNTVENFTYNESDAGSLISNQIWKVFTDNSKIVWIGSFGQGLGHYDKFRYKISAFTNFDIKNGGLSDKQVNAIFEASDGNIWIGTRNGINKFDRKKFKLTEYYMPGLEITMIKEVGNNYLLLASTTGLFLFNPISRKSIAVYQKNSVSAVSQDHITVVKIDKANNLWFAVYDEGLYCIRSFVDKNGNINISNEVVNYIKGLDVPNSNSANIIWDINFISEDELWLATNKNITRFIISSGKLETMAKFAHSVFYDKIPGETWVGSLGQGLARIGKTTTEIKHYTISDGLASDVILGMQSDYDGNIWMSTNTGISRFNPITGQIRNYDTYDGLVSRRFILHSTCKTTSGELLFGSDNGFIIFDPSKVKDSPYTPFVKITDIKVLNKSITYEKALAGNRKIEKPLDGINQLTLNHLENTVTINFVALCFSAPEKVKYAYMLEGFDEDWVYTGFENRSATYTNLDGGDYVFKVKATNPDGIWSEQISKLNLTITPPFWKTHIFRVFAIVAFAFLILFLYRSRIKQVKNIALKKYNDEKLRRESEISALNNEKLDVELEFKKKELASSTLDIIRKNEELTKLHDELVKISHDVIPKNRARIQNLIKEIEKGIDDINQWEYFEKNFNVLHGDFLKRFATEYPLLTHKDLKICAFIRMNFDNKEIAKTLNITIESLGVSRTRIRKKIGIEEGTFLNDFILRY